jgi:uncharacterized membrane protein YhiD involved in acid resistance
MKLASEKRREVLTLIIVFTGVLLISAFAVYVIGGRRNGVETTSNAPAQPSGVLRGATDRSEPAATPGNNDTFFDRLFGTQGTDVFVAGERWVETVGRLSLRLLLAALLGAALAFRPRKRILALKRNPYVSQTQILLAIVAAALMIIVGDNAARAFGIFAAVSLVRFRTNIRDPKEITVLLISLALGLASGVGRWDLAMVLALFSLIVLWLLEWREPQLVFRSMELKVTTRNVITTQQALRSILRKHGFDKELRAIDREVTEESPGSLVYSIDISPMVSTDELSEDILKMDGLNVEAIAWDQKKSYSYLYQ